MLPIRPLTESYSHPIPPNSPQQPAGITIEELTPPSSPVHDMTQISNDQYDMFCNSAAAMKAYWDGEIARAKGE